MSVWLSIDASIAPEDAAAFEAFVIDDYEKALETQAGFVRSVLVRAFADDYLAAIQAQSDGFQYRLAFEFGSEDERLRWVGSDEHTVLWPRFQQFCKNVRYCGYDVLSVI